MSQGSLSTKIPWHGLVLWVTVRLVDTDSIFKGSAMFKLNTISGFKKNIFKKRIHAYGLKYSFNPVHSQQVADPTHLISVGIILSGCDGLASRPLASQAKGHGFDRLLNQTKYLHNWSLPLPCLERNWIGFCQITWLGLHLFKNIYLYIIIIIISHFTRESVPHNNRQM